MPGYSMNLKSRLRLRLPTETLILIKQLSNKNNSTLSRTVRDLLDDKLEGLRNQQDCLKEAGRDVAD